MNSTRSSSDDQAEDHDLVRAIAVIVREADERFETEGGTSRHWVRDHFLPGLNAAGYSIVGRGR